jgi:hypothetical protein
VTDVLIFFFQKTYALEHVNNARGSEDTFGAGKLRYVYERGIKSKKKKGVRRL